MDQTTKLLLQYKWCSSLVRMRNVGHRPVKLEPERIITTKIHPVFNFLELCCRRVFVAPRSSGSRSDASRCLGAVYCNATTNLSVEHVVEERVANGGRSRCAGGGGEGSRGTRRRRLRMEGGGVCGDNITTCSHDWSTVMNADEFVPLVDAQVSIHSISIGALSLLLLHSMILVPCRPKWCGQLGFSVMRSCFHHPPLLVFQSNHKAPCYPLMRSVVARHGKVWMAHILMCLFSLSGHRRQQLYNCSCRKW